VPQIFLSSLVCRNIKKVEKHWRRESVWLEFWYTNAVKVNKEIKAKLSN